MTSINVGRFDKAIIGALSAWPAALRPLFVFMSYVGHPITTCLVGFLLFSYGIYQHDMAMSLGGVSTWAAMGVSTVLKYFIERPRPITTYAAGMRVRSFSFPSGHATGSTVAFGLLAYYAAQLLAFPAQPLLVVLLAGLIFLVGLSRVYLGAHYPTDVIGGWLLGGIVLSIVIFIAKPLI